MGNVLVTGGASFIGSHLVERLVELDHGVRVVDDLSSGDLENLESLDYGQYANITSVPSPRVADTDVQFVKGNLKNRAIAEAAMWDIDIVFHLAADHGGRGYIANHPAKCATNMALDNIVFEAAAQSDVDKVVFASSACVYPTYIQSEDDSMQMAADDWTKFPATRDKLRLEEEMVNWNNPLLTYSDEEYGWAKLMGEMSLQAHHEEYGIDAAIGRIFTAYGPRENETHAIIALISKALSKQEPFEIWGDGTQTRNFTYVDDIVSGLIFAAEHIDDATPVNIGREEFISVNEVTEAIFDYIDWHPDEIDFLTDKPVGVKHRAADLTRMGNLGWEPEVTLEEGLARTIDWYREEKDIDVVQDQLETLLHER